MNNENNFEVQDIDLAEIDQIVEIKDEELKQVTGGNEYTEGGNWGPLCGIPR